MLRVGITRQQMDTLDTDPNIALTHQIICPSCRKAVSLRIVKLGSQMDYNLTYQSTENIEVSLWRGVKNFLGMPKIIRMRLQAPQFLSLRAGCSIRSKAGCPECRQLVEITIQPT